MATIIPVIIPAGRIHGENMPDWALGIMVGLVVVQICLLIYLLWDSNR